MTPHDTETGRTLRLSTLLRLRWMAVIGQTAAVGGVAFGFGFEFPFELCFMLVGASALLNVILALRFQPNHRLKPFSATWLLAWDLTQVSALLMLTGGLLNPFSLLIIVPVVIAAGALPLANTLMLAAVTAGLTIVLSFMHLPLPWRAGEVLTAPPLLTAGTAIAILLTMGFAALYAGRVAREARELSDALAATELVLQREQHLSAIDGLAAATAHELGTPLATITVIAKEMERALGADERFGEDVALLRSQSERCRAILGRLTSLSAESEEHMMRMPMTALMEEAIAPHREFGVEIIVSQGPCSGPEPIGRRNPGLIYSLGNLIENAVDFAKSKVVVTYAWTERDVFLSVTDDGRGFSPTIIGRLGEPYATERSSRDRISKPPTTVGEGGGMGLGLFIAKTLIERAGATVSFSNASAEEMGARVRLQWSRAVFEASDSDAPRLENSRWGPESLP
ncbi:MAG: ActS/PrrB/RegB family redox-sensitive histidine kinase [Rhizobiaceae bacterium]|nr:ActS/PrrB/RegB family redox-sensitive histidine kinase [Rhizobiaceae bacterium]